MVTLSLLAAVFGIFQRTQVVDNSKAPYAAIGLLERGCTATLIAPDVIVTAAHCVYDMDLETWKERDEFSPGQNKKNKPFGTYTFRKIFIPEEYFEGDRKFDVAFIRLNKKVTSVMPIIPEPDAAVEDETVSVIGYPGDEKFGTLWQSDCPVEKKTSQVLKYRCDTYKGESGSPVVAYKNRIPYIVGVHVRGSKMSNEATYLSDELLDLFQESL